MGVGLRRQANRDLHFRQSDGGINDTRVSRRLDGQLNESD
jgi:hypothetical protein